MIDPIKYSDIKDSQKQDEYLAQLMKKQFDAELKEKWAKQLETEYPADRLANPKKKKTIIRRLFPYISGIAACLLVFFAYNHSFQGDTISAESYLLAEFNNPMSHPGNTKGLIMDTNARQNGITQFNEHKFNEASQSFSQIDAASTEDRFYQAMAYFYLKQFDKAIPIFEQLLTTKSNLTQEIKWYLALSQLSQHDLPAAKKSFGQISKAEWNYAKAQKILETL